MLEFKNNLWGLGSEYRNRIVVPAHQATKAGGIVSLESILGSIKVEKFGICAQICKPLRSLGINSKELILWAS